METFRPDFRFPFHVYRSVHDEEIYLKIIPLFETIRNKRLLKYFCSC